MSRTTSQRSESFDISSSTSLKTLFLSPSPPPAPLPSSSTSASKEEPFFFKPLKKAYTMTHTPTFHTPETLSFKHDDILYRKHFGSKPVLHRSYKSLEGLYGSTSPLSKPKISTIDIPPISVESTAPSNENDCIIVIDCFSTGAMVAHEALQRGYKVISIQSFENPELAALVPSNCRSDYSEKLVYEETYDDDGLRNDVAINLLIETLHNLTYNIIAVIAGAETGVGLSDRLSSRLSSAGNESIKTNGEIDTENRRNKYKMGEVVRSSSLRAVAQTKASTWSEIKTFLDVLNPDPYKVIVKPLESAGSDDVTLCKSEEEVKLAFGNIMGKVNGLGAVNDGVLVQEYLEGIEYVLDTISLNGVHKVICLWEYDRRPTNNAGFVLHGQRIMDASEDRAKEMIEYQFKVLDALNIKNGPSHGEVKWFKGEPCLVEVGSRCHGAEGVWVTICTECLTYNQVNACLDMYTKPSGSLFDLYPERCIERKAHGCVKYMISYQKGAFINYNKECIEEIEGMSSYRSLECFLKPGGRIKLTIDCFTWCGCILMANVDVNVLNADYKRIEEMCTTGELYNVTPDIPLTPTLIQLNLKKAVVVVDPFCDEGASLASAIYRKGYAVFCVYSSKLKEMENTNVNLIPKDLEIHFSAVIAQTSKADEKEIADQIAKIAKEMKCKVLACVKGAETGGALCGKLNALLGLDAKVSEDGTLFVEL